MAAAFSPRANMLFTAAGVAFVIVLFGTPALLMAWVRSPLAEGRDTPPIQPVPFDHRHHVREDGIDCRYCHSSAERSPYAGVPPSSVCMGCHAQVWSDSPLLEPVRKSFFEGTPIRWLRVHNLPDFVFFDHSAHLAADLGCESCHGQVDLMPAVHQVAPLTMSWCVDCHRSHADGHISPPVHCSGCHR
jgi:hypothetical protein